MSKNKTIVMTNELDVKLQELDAITSLVQLKLRVLEKDKYEMDIEDIEVLIMLLIQLNTNLAAHQRKYCTVCKVNEGVKRETLLGTYLSLNPLLLCDYCWASSSANPKWQEKAAAAAARKKGEIK